MTYDPNNVFAKIIRGEIPCKKVFEDEDIFAFDDIAAAAPAHVLVVPKGEFVSFNDFAQKAGAEKVGIFFQKVQKVVELLGLEEGGYRIITNHGKNASQSVFHFHVHILGGKQLGALLPGDEADR